MRDLDRRVAAVAQAAGDADEDFGGVLGDAGAGGRRAQRLGVHQHGVQQAAPVGIAQLDDVDAVAAGGRVVEVGPQLEAEDVADREDGRVLKAWRVA